VFVRYDDDRKYAIRLMYQPPSGVSLLDLFKKGGSAGGAAKQGQQDGGNLVWEQIGTNPDKADDFDGSSALPLLSVTGLHLGKSHSTMARTENAMDGMSFSIAAKLGKLHVNLNLEASSPAVRASWMFGLRGILRRFGRKIRQHGKAPADDGKDADLEYDSDEDEELETALFDDMPLEGVFDSVECFAGQISVNDLHSAMVRLEKRDASASLSLVDRARAANSRYGDDGRRYVPSLNLAARESCNMPGCIIS